MADAAPTNNKGKRKIDELARAIEKSRRKLKSTEVRVMERERARPDALCHFSAPHAALTTRSLSASLSPLSRKSCATCVSWRAR